jgi:putative ABC transport system permease protein
MIKNYFITALRNFKRNKLFSAINILGLAIGISAALVIFLLVSYDFSFEKFHKDGDRIYRVVTNFEFSGEKYNNAGVPAPMGSAVNKEATGVEITCAFHTWNDNVKVTIPSEVKNVPTVFKKQPQLVFADENYFRLISYEWLAGSPASALQQPYQVVLTSANAALYFPGLKPAEIIGRQLYFNDSIAVTVSGIVKNLDYNTDFNFKTFISLISREQSKFKENATNGWENTSSTSQLFVKLSPGTTPAHIQKQVMGLYKKYHKDDPNDHGKTEYALQPLSDIHFNPKYDNFDQRLAHKPTLYGLLAVAAFLLLLACINFINLSTAQSSQRAKEIGIRKTMGSSKYQLVTQYLGETFVLTLVATILSVILTPLLLKVFSDFVPEGLHFNVTSQPKIILFLLLLTIIVTALSGAYPAFIMAAYKPVLALKNQAYRNTGQTRSAWLRKTLTVSQFVIAQVFIIGTILVSKQISYTLNKDLGYKKDAIVYFDINYYDTSRAKKNLLIQELKAMPEVAMISMSNNPPSSNSVWSSTVKYKDGKTERLHDVQIKTADTNYIKLYQLKLLAGTNLAPSDTTNGYLINATYASILGFKDPRQAIGKLLEMGPPPAIPVVGVVGDFHQKSLREPIKPLLIASKARQSRTVNVALQSTMAPGALKTAIAKMEKTWKGIYPEDDFKYIFFDDSIKNFYKSEQSVSKLLMWATGLSVFISCLGLLGLAIYVTNQRTKEIGVRKIIGASVVQLITLLSKDFLRLILFAFIIAVPIAWWGAGKWLENFAYRTTISWWIFAGGGLIMFITAFIILAIRTFRAATANPVNSLRSE